MYTDETSLHRYAVCMACILCVSPCTSAAISLKHTWLPTRCQEPFLKKTITEQRWWDGQGSPPRQWKKVTPPYDQHCQLYTNWFTDCVCMCVCVSMHNHWAPGRVAFRLKGYPSLNKNPLSFISVCTTSSGDMSYNWLELIVQEHVTADCVLN